MRASSIVAPKYENVEPYKVRQLQQRTLHTVDPKDLLKMRIENIKKLKTIIVSVITENRSNRRHTPYAKPHVKNNDVTSANANTQRVPESCLATGHSPQETNH